MPDSGDSAASELERLTPGDISGLKSGKQKYTVLTNNDGGIIDDIIITRFDSGLMVIVNAACKDKDFSHFKSIYLTGVRLKNWLITPVRVARPLCGKIIDKFSASAADLSFMQACETDINGIPCSISRSGYTAKTA